MTGRSLDPEGLYRRVGRLIEIAPPSPTTGQLSPDLMKWLGQVTAVLKEVDDMVISVEVKTAITGLQYPNRGQYFQTIMLGLYQALAIAELKAPQSAQGAFIPVGNAFDAFSAIAKILGSAHADVLIVDPYMDDSVLTDFASSLPENVPLRLLTDQATAKQSLSPAAIRWKAQYSSRPLEVRLAPARTLHDRAIFVDSTQAWTVTQSLKDLAKRSPAEIVRADDTAALKIAAYEAIWANATVVV
ncbi:phosphatidylserine/phosphatidylglycerophosphate/cardiolipin synthase family protein [Bradyrhizobium ottawaense]|uniref:Indole-3-glycerol-phosphate synthase n=1 Tax=Bradyrhizobium ottawaense TaxID=931866 RepID=A0ABV4G340_9BRAD